MSRRLVIFLTMVLGAFTVPSWSQSSGTQERLYDWQACFTSGYFTGGTVLRTHVRGEPVTVRTDPGWQIGLKLGADQEYTGLELTTAAVFANMDIEHDPYVTFLPSSDNATWLFANVDALIYPTGNQLVDGRVRPFIAIGPGLAHLSSDFDQADNKTIFDVNVGGGIKLLLGDQGNPVIRLDWRWHYLVGSTAGLENQMYRQELTLGIGFRF